MAEFLTGEDTGQWREAVEVGAVEEGRLVALLDTLEVGKPMAPLGTAAEEEEEEEEEKEEGALARSRPVDLPTAAAAGPKAKPREQMARMSLVHQ